MNVRTRLVFELVYYDVVVPDISLYTTGTTPGSGYRGIVEYSFFAITPRSTLNRSGSTCKGYIYEPKRPV